MREQEAWKLLLVGQTMDEVVDLGDRTGLKMLCRVRKKKWSRWISAGFGCYFVAEIIKLRSL